MGIDDFSMLPADDEISPAADVDAAEASAIAAADPILEAAEPPEPFGRTPLFDFERGRMVRAGIEPVWVSGRDAVKVWCLMALYSARYAHAVFTDAFGMDDPEGPIGLAADAREAGSDWVEHAREALLVHDRISAVEIAARYVPADQTMYIDRLEVITDEDESLDFGSLSVRMGGPNG